MSKSYGLMDSFDNCIKWVEELEVKDPDYKDRVLARLRYECDQSKPSAQQWIPMSERPPEKTGKYLVTNSAGEIFDVDWNAWVNGEWLFPNSAPIAWMPLPEPYEGGDAE